MAIVAGDLVAYASGTPAGDPPGPTTDTETPVGGPIDLDYQVIFSTGDLGADDDLEVLSASAGDTTQKVKVIARDSTGALKNEEVTLNGTTAVIFSTMGVVSQIMSIEMDSDAVGIVTVRRSVAGATIHDIPIGERGAIRLFRNAASETGATTRYAKFFWKNTNATLALLGAQLTEQADPSSKITHAVGTACDDTETVTKRKTAPAAVTAFGAGPIAVPSPGDLAPGAAIAVWLKMDLTADDAPIAAANDTYTSKLDGTTGA